MKLGSFSTPNLSFPKPKVPKFKSMKQNLPKELFNKYKPQSMISDVKSKLPDSVKKHIPDKIGNGNGLDVGKMMSDKMGDVDGILSKNNKTDDIINSFSSQNINDFLPNDTFNGSKDIFSKAFKF